jgi:hypothetical protein
VNTQLPVEPFRILARAIRQGPLGRFTTDDEKRSPREDSGEAERSVWSEAERHSGMIANTIGAWRVATRFCRKVFGFVKRDLLLSLPLFRD